MNRVPSTSLPAIILAAGAGRRFGGDKLLAHYRHRPLILWTLEKWCRHPRVGNITMVVQPKARGLAEVSSMFPQVTLLENPDWERGLGTSVASGIKTINTDGVLIGLADTPFFKDATLDLVIPKAEEQGDIHIPSFEGLLGHPKYFPSWCFQELSSLSADQGAKSVIERHPDRCRKIPCGDPGILRDFDTPEDFH